MALRAIFFRVFTSRYSRSRKAKFSYVAKSINLFGKTLSKQQSNKFQKFAVMKFSPSIQKGKRARKARVSRKNHSRASLIVVIFFLFVNIIINKSNYMRCFLSEEIRF